MALPSIADMLPIPARGPAMSMAQAMTAPEEPENEAGEPEIEAVPRLDRSVFAYMEARKGIDGEQYFGACGSCQNFVAEAYMRGAVRGARCAILGSNMTVNDDSSCDRWLPWPDGQPDSGCIAEMADGMVAGCRGSTSPMAVGFLWDKRKVCTTCRQFEGAESECSFFECLNQTCPSLFMLDTNIVTPAKCSAWSEIPTPEYG